MTKRNRLLNKVELQKKAKDILENYENKSEYKRYREQEDCLNQLFVAIYPNNNNLSEILAKVACLNAYYSTNVLALNKMANNIVNIKNLQERLNNGDSKLVEEIANIEEIPSRRFYSFATKYCFRYNQDEFPIFDSNVEYVLKCFIRETENCYKITDLKDYVQFKKIINDFKNYYELNLSARDLDHFLWIYGKELKPNSNTGGEEI